MADKRETVTETMSDKMIFRTIVETILSKSELDLKMKIDFLRHSFEDHNLLIEILEDLILSHTIDKHEGNKLIFALSS